MGYAPYDVLVTETQRLSQLLKTRCNIYDLIEADYKAKDVEMPTRYRVGPKILWPSDASRAAIIGTYEPMFSFDEALFRRCVRMTLLDKPAPVLWLRRSSGIGSTFNNDLDYVAKYNREQFIKSGDIARQWDPDLISTSTTHVNLRVEQKGKGTKDKPKEVYNYKGNKDSWVSCYDESSRLYSLRARPIYAHPPYNLFASMLASGTSFCKYSKTTTPRLTVPVAQQFSSELGPVGSYEFVDASRMGTSIPTLLLQISAEEICKRWVEWTDLPYDYFYSFMQPTVIAPNIEYPDDIGFTLSQHCAHWGPAKPIVRSKVIAGNLDGKPGTTDDNNRVFLYWLQLLRRQYKLPEYKTLDEVSSSPYYKVFFVGDTGLIVVPLASSFSANQIAKDLDLIVQKNSNGSNLKIETQEADTWCGYRGYLNDGQLILVRDEIASLFKILAPEYPPLSAMRPNWLAGFEAMFDMWTNIPDSYRTTKRSTVIEVLNILKNALRLITIRPNDSTLSAEDLSLYYYDPRYVNQELPLTYFIRILIDEFVNLMKQSSSKDLLSVKTEFSYGRSKHFTSGDNK